MCGIAGFIGKGDSAVLKSMAQTLAHRGPDDSGVWQEGEVGLAHRRLSIIDLSYAGHQPMLSRDGMVVLTFNGEIYNFKTLRDELKTKGYLFKSESDTEVIVRMYEAYGERAFARLDGMFAFGLYDKQTKTLYLVRDRAGEKPLYYALTQGTFVFASEPKALFKHPLVSKQISTEGLVSYLTYDAPLTPGSLWQNVHKVRPSTYVKFENGKMSTHVYWHPPHRRAVSFNAAQHELDAVLHKSISAQLVSDVPLGVFLSGGLDSSLVAYYAKKQAGELHTFSLGFDESSYDESPYAREVATRLDTIHHEHVVSSVDVRDALPHIVKKLDEPISDPAILPQYLLSRFAREKVKVALSGDGGDELFLGYPTFTAQKLLAWYKRLPFALRKNLIEPGVRMLPVSHRYLSFDFKAKQFIRGADQPPEYAHQGWLESFNQEEQREMLLPEFREHIMHPYAPLDEHMRDFPHADPYTGASYLYLRTYLLDVLLAKADRASMYNSLEVRAPLLSHDVLNLAFEMPAKFKHRGGTGKYILRTLMDGKLPKNTVWRTKHGFGLPVGAWFQNEWRELLCDTLAETAVRNAGLCEPSAVQKLVKEHLDRTHNHRKKLWSLLMLHLWYDFWVK